MSKKYYLVLSQEERDQIDEFEQTRSPVSNAFNKIKSLLITECCSEVYNKRQHDPIWVSWNYMIPYDLIFEIGKDTAIDICAIIKQYNINTMTGASIDKLIKLYNEVNPKEKL